MYIRAHAKYGVIPLVQRTSDLEYHTVFITGTTSSIYSLRDLKGKQLAFGDVDSTSAHLMPFARTENVLNRKGWLAAIEEPETVPERE